MSNPASRAHTDSAAKSPSTGAAQALAQPSERRGLAELQRIAGNRLVASLFEGPPPSQDPQEQEAERVSAHAATRDRLHLDSYQVQVHEGEQAREMSEAIGAKAFTLGNDVFFNSGMGPSAGSQNRVLLAHELVHVLQQRNGAFLKIQRAPKDDFGKMPSGGKVTPASDQDKRDFIRESTVYLQAMADQYEAKIQIAQLSKTSPKVSAKDILPKWKATIETDLKLLDDKSDLKLLNDLKTAYRNMVKAIVTAESMSQSKETLRETFERYRRDIHESGWLLGVAEPAANQLSDAIPEAERAKIQVITTTTVSEAMLNLGNAFSPLAKTSPPSGVKMVYPGIAPKLQRGFDEIAKSLVQTLTPPPLKLNSTITLALDLSKFGGDYALYRFTYFQHTETQGKKKVSEKQLLVERLGTVGMEGLRENDAAWKKFGNHNFKFKGMWKTAEKEAVLAATQLMPDSELSLVSGINFERQSAGKDGEAGHYEVETHTVAIFDLAFADSAVRFGNPGASLATPATYSVVHEIGHAIDRRKYREHLVAKDAASTAVRDKFKRFEKSGADGGWSIDLPDNTPRDVVDEFNAMMAKATAADKASLKVVTESGERFQGTDFKDDATLKKPPEFRTAGAGARISPYADKQWREYFAESYAMYVAEPATLQRLRPKLFDYFTKNHPKGTP